MSESYLPPPHLRAAMVNAVKEHAAPLAAAIMRVRALHHPSRGMCAACGVDYPCPTILALEGGA